MDIKTLRKEKYCPRCGFPCERHEVDIGVGVQYGPWYCTECGWTEEETIDGVLRVDEE